MPSLHPNPPATPSLLPPPGTFTLCLLTLITAIIQGVTGIDRVAQAVGFAMENVFKPVTLIQISDEQIFPGAMTLFTYVFPHGGWWHVLPNMTAFWLFGAIAEREIGTARFVTGYFISGAIGVFCYGLVVPNATEPLAGASLAIAGLAGGYFARRWFTKPHTALQRRIVLISEMVLVATSATWLIIRNVPATPNLLSSIMYHFIPFFVMWLGVRSYEMLKLPQAHQ